jgi:hypothetical protein
MCIEVFRRWYDLWPSKDTYQFVTVYDTTNNFVRDDDFARIREYSGVFGFPSEQDTLRELLIV